MLGLFPFSPPLCPFLPLLFPPQLQPLDDSRCPGKVLGAGAYFFSSPGFWVPTVSHSVCVALPREMIVSGPFHMACWCF